MIHEVPVRGVCSDDIENFSRSEETGTYHKVQRASTHAHRHLRLGPAECAERLNPPPPACRELRARRRNQIPPETAFNFLHSDIGILNWSGSLRICQNPSYSPPRRPRAFLKILRLDHASLQKNNTKSLCFLKNPSMPPF